MKKLVLLLAVAFSVSMFSCSGNGEAAATEEPEAVEAVEVEAIEAPADSAAVEATDSAAVEAPAAEEAAPAE